MTIAHLLEDFGPGGRLFATGQDEENMELEEQKLTAFENGYSAGWEDAVKAQDDDHMRLSTQLSRNLQDLSFTYQEAYTQMLGSVAPVLQAITHQMLPRAVHRSLGAVVVEELQTITAHQGAMPVEIVTAPDSLPAVEALLPADLAMPVRIIGDATLMEGQAFLRVGREEREVNLDSLLINITDAIDAFAYQVQKELSHG
ncbi:MAG: ABC transporter ATP-binding protein [Rhodobacteraceae bacterium]|nr:ABC transporter ATP-binding protein [Paracoccaceae bacterium]